MTPPGAQEEFEKRILHGLVSEWRRAADILAREHGHKLRLPGFELKNLEHIVGLWQPEKHTIAISRKAALDTSWISIREVLLHEMAHQLTDEALGGDDTPHGRQFHRACRLLGANPSASGDSVTLFDHLNVEEPDENDRVLLRVKKLLAMAQSSNRHEAEVAMMMAHEHIAKYNLDLLAAEKTRNYCSVCVGEPSTRHTVDKYSLASLLRDFYFVETVMIPCYVLRSGRMGSVLEVSGTTENVKMANYVYEFIRRTIKDQRNRLDGHGRLSVRQATDFAVGLISGFREKMEAQEKSWESANKPVAALIRRSDRGLRNYLRDRYHRLRTSRRGGRTRDHEVYGAGRNIGKNLILSKPIETAGRIRRLLLGR